MQAPSLNANQWYETAKWFDYQGFDIPYFDSGEADAGNGEVLVLIHGFPTCSLDWIKIWQPLSKHYRLIAFDLLGFGRSSKPLIKYTISRQADMIESLLHKLGVDRFALVAHDYGDTVAQELLSRTNVVEQTWACVLSNGGLFPETHKPLLVQKLLLSPIGGLVAQLMSYEKFKRSMGSICQVNIDEQEIQEYWLLLTGNNGKQIFSRLIKYMTERKRHRTRWVSALQNYQKPLLLINGLDDPISGEHMVERFHKLVPNGLVEAKRGIGHYPQLEAPEWFSESLQGFLENLSSKPS